MKTQKKNTKEPHPFGAVLERIRKEKKLTAYGIAKRAGRQTSQVYLLEAGNSAPQIKTIIWLAKAMDMEPRDLFHELYLALEEEECSEKKT